MNSLGQLLIWIAAIRILIIFLLPYGLLYVARKNTRATGTRRGWSMPLPFSEILFLIVGNLLTERAPQFLTIHWGLCLIAVSYVHFLLFIRLTKN